MDSIGETFAKKHGIPVERYPADWDNHKKAAGPIRNAKMAEIADAAIVIRTETSRGSQHMADQMRLLGKPVKELVCPDTMEDAMAVATAMCEKFGLAVDPGVIVASGFKVHTPEEE